MRLYIDTCCWGRPWDGKTQADVVAESAAIGEIIDRRHINGHIIIGSPILSAEILKNPNAKDRDEVKALYRSTVDRYTKLTPKDDVRAAVFLAAGLKTNDSYHLALAERVGVDVLLTVDRKFLKRVASKNLSRVKVMNPLTFIGG